MTYPTNADVYKESLQSARHLSALRFAILTVFMTATGALVNTYYSNIIGLSRLWILFAGLWLAIVFVIIEIVLSFTMSRHNKTAKNKAGDSHKDSFIHRHPIALWAIRIAIPSIHIFVAIFWVYLYQLNLSEHSTVGEWEDSSCKMKLSIFKDNTATYHYAGLNHESCEWSEKDSRLIILKCSINKPHDQTLTFKSTSSNVGYLDGISPGLSDDGFNMNRTLQKNACSAKP